jgi:ABC-2 type transport system permease protein
MTMYTAICGFVFYNSTAFFVIQSMRMQMSGGMGMPSLSLNEHVIRPILAGVMTVVLVFMIPLITMRLYPEEKKSGTIELLLTSPLTDLQIILGKFLGALTLYAILEALTFLYFGVLFAYGNPNAKPLIANALGMLLFGAMLLAIDMWISTFTKNQIIAAVVAMAVNLLLYLLDWVSAITMSAWGQVVSYLALTTHFDNFSKGVTQLSDVVYYLSAILLGLFLTARSVEALKGRP